MASITLRPARAGDGAAVFAVTHQSIIELANGCYSAEQLRGWMGQRTPDDYERAIAKGRMVVACSEVGVVGFVDAEPGMRIAREEIFGPVACIVPADNFEHALALANDTAFGLSAGICTSSLKHATQFKREAQAGMVMVNAATAGVDYHVPFGGRKGSSYGPREQGRYAAEFFTTVKTAYTAA